MYVIYVLLLHLSNVLISDGVCPIAATVVAAPILKL